MAKIVIEEPSKGDLLKAVRIYHNALKAVLARMEADGAMFKQLGHYLMGSVLNYEADSEDALHRGNRGAFVTASERVRFYLEEEDNPCIGR